MIPTVHLLDIAAVARRTGTPASALRFYEEKGLIASVGRHGLKRLFDRDVLDRLAFIALGRQAGFSLDEIGRMLGPHDGSDPDVDRDLLTVKADDLDRTLRRLTGLRDGLRHAAVCPARNHVECPTFQRLLNVASARSGKIRRAASPGSGS